MASGGQRAASATPGPLIRIVRAWRKLGREQHVTAIAALTLWLTMFLPWYSESGLTSRSAVSLSLSAWDVFSFVELAVLAVSVAVLALLFARGERRAFHLPGGDGSVIVVAGGWVTLLIFYRILDKPSARGVITGVGWGIFMALAAAIWLTYTGVQMRRAHRAEPALADDPTVHLRGLRPQRPRRERPAPDDPARQHRGVTREDAEQLSFELPNEHEQ
jgi:hypothetical protein